MNIEKNKRLKISDHANEIINVLGGHEKQHYEDFKTLGNEMYSKLSSTKRERSAYSAQMKHSSFKNTRKGFQEAIIDSALKYGKIVPYIVMPITPL
ncbi:MAG: hypothetical protein ACWA42_01760 [Lutibacter sp.]